MRSIALALAVILAPAQPAALARLTFTASPGSYAVLRFHVDEPAAAPVPATAVDVMVNGVRDQTVVLTPGAGRPSYSAVLGPLSKGSYDVRLEPSTSWTWSTSLRITQPSIQVVAPDDKQIDVLSNAPAIGVRPDTIGTASDLPLLMYVEDVVDGGARWLKYSVIFSNEDGGTPGVALMARWGRTTDIELAYEVEVRDGRAVQGRYQGPDHRVIAKARLDVHPPLLLVTTMNNMFLDRGQPPAIVRMVPEVVDLTGRPRESVMDDRPWTYRVMARELATERPAWVGDPRDYVFVDVKLESRGAGIAVGARTDDGVTRWSDRGRPELVVSRQEEMRLAVPAPAARRVAAVAIRCDPRGDAAAATELPSCQVEVRKVFRLGAEYEPGRNLIAPARFSVEAGSAREVAIATADKINP
jgi:hypothetical protein